MKIVLRVMLLLGFGLLATAAAPNWLTTITVSKAGGHVLGNPAAKVKLMAFESYTCHFCHAFEDAASGPIRLVYVQPGKVSLEVRHIVRDPVDLTAAMLTECAPPAKFFDIHRALYLHFDTTLDLLEHHTKAQEDSWRGAGAGAAAGRRSIASDFGFYDILESQGVTRPRATQCLNDETLAKKLLAQSEADSKAFDIPGTPAFAIDGKPLYATSTWDLLQPQIDARL